MEMKLAAHFEPGTEFTVGVELPGPLVSIAGEKLFGVRLGQLSTWYVSPHRAQENWEHPAGTMKGSSGLECETVPKPGPLYEGNALVD
jgi:hypothetical protein